MLLIRTLIFAVIFASSCIVQARVERLPALADSGRWLVETGGESSAGMEVRQWPGYVVVEFSGETGRSASLMLREPLPIPSWADGFTAMMLNEGGEGRVNVLAVIEDEGGKRFLYKMLAPTPNFDSGYPVYKAGSRLHPERLQAVGLKRPKVGKGHWDTILGLDGNAPPEGRLVLKGLHFVAGTPSPARAILAFGEFAWTHLSPKASAGYYAFEGQECFAELEPQPGLALASLGRTHGRYFDVTWEVRDRYEGLPFLTGRQDFHLNPQDTETPYALQLAQKIEFPFLPKGTYWIRTKLRWSRDGGPIPEVIEEQDRRLDVIRSQKKDLPLETASGKPPYIQIGVGHPSLVYEKNEERVVSVVFAGDGPGWHYRLLATPFGEDEVAREVSGEISGSSPVHTAIDLSKLPGTVWTIRAEVLSGDRLVDVSERVIGLREQTAKQVAGPVKPSSLPEDPTGGKSKIVLFPQIPDEMRDDPRKRWEGLQPFLEQVGTVTDCIELPVRWKDVEIFPGVYDWSWLDHVMDTAAERGLSVILDLQFVGLEPTWMPAYFTQNREGGVFGHQRYLFCGMRANYWQAKPLRNAVLDYFGAAARRYAEHPACKGYLILTEHPGEFPYTGWFDGYEPETLENFRRYVSEKWKNLTAVNERWGTAFAQWEEIGPPEAEASSRFRLDWLTFRQEKIAALLLDQVRTVRAEDPEAFIELYGDGLSPANYPEVRELGCILANGGANEPELWGLLKAGVAAYGLQERAEERSVGHWSAYGPTQLDSTLFAMMYGGGANAHCKMFVRSNSAFDDLRPPKHSLGRFEQFIPIWQELRKTETPVWKAYVLNNLQARLLAANSATYTSFGDSNTVRSFLESHLVAPSVDAEMALSGRLLFCLSAFGLEYEKELVDRLVSYVEKGGTLVMTADAGRTSPDMAGEDWVLLSRFGIRSPVDGSPAARIARARTLQNEVFPEGNQAFSFAGPIWRASEQDGVLAVFDDGVPAITSRSFGKGKVVVLWASRLIPPSHGNGYPYLADIARWAGVDIPSRSSDPRFYTNLLKHRSGDIHYALVYHSGSHMPWGQPGNAVESRTHWQLPEGTYKISELISGSSLEESSAKELQGKGIIARLEPHAVAIYRMERINDRPLN